MMRRSGFSLLELVIVVVIIGVVAAIAVPRISSTAQNSDQAALQYDLTILTKALEHYAAEHGGQYPDDAKVTEQLTQYTNPGGDVSPAPDATHYLGPYLRSVPPLPVGSHKGDTGIANADGPGVGWLYSQGRQTIRPNMKPDMTDEQLDEYVEKVVKGLGGR